MSDPQKARQTRPKAFPPPQFPPHRPKLFARMPPAVFPVLMGLLGLGLALRRGLVALELPVAAGELLLGLAVGLWAFAVFGYGVKIARRPGVVIEDLKTLPGRAGLAAATLGLLLGASAMVPYAPGLAHGMLYTGLALHAGLAALVLRQFFSLPPEAREITPVWHLHFVGFIIGALSAAPLGLTALAQALLYGTIPLAGAIWAVSLAQFARRIPPAPLRPLLAIHLAPASLFATVAASLDLPLLALIFAALAAALFLTLLFAVTWLTTSGFSALWGAFTFPIAAFCSALYATGFAATATVLLIFALGLIPALLLKTLTAWSKGGLAAKTNAAEA